MTREEMDFIGGMNMCDEISNEAYKKIMCHCEELEPCEDCISREAVHDLIATWLSDYLSDDTREVLEVIDEKVEDLPTVTPKAETITEFADRCRECGAKYGKLLESKIGHWTYCPDDNGEFEEYPACWCSQCFEYAPILPNDKIAKYCPNCGCRMVE